MKLIRFELFNTVLRGLRRTLPLAGAVLAAAIATSAQPALAQTWTTDGWGATWGTAPAGPPPSTSQQYYSVANQTVRLIVRTSISGTRVRIRLSNELGTTPLRIGSANVGLRSSGAAIVAGSGRALTFGGLRSVTIPAGAPALSDPVSLTVPAMADLAVSLYLPGTVPVSSLHDLALQTSYVSTPGDFTASTTIPVQRYIGWWPLLTEVAVASSGPVVVAIGDSITDGSRSTSNTNRRWPDYLARRLQAAGGTNARIGVVNRGIAGNRMLVQTPTNLLAGQSLANRFGRDVLSTPGVKSVIVLIGINDIGYSSSSAPVTAAALIEGYRQLIMRAHSKGISVLGATLLPFEGAAYYTAAKNGVRQAVNDWIRGSGELDGVIDFDAVMRDPSRPTRLLPAYDSSDHLHPNDLGYQTMGNAVPLTLVSAAAVAPTPVADELSTLP
ncbi:MAG TPA: SGNH/GDSL hydrolase family protein [Telluria sp.]